MSFSLQFVHGQAGSKSNNAFHSAMLLAGHFEPVALTTKAFLRSFFCLEAHPNLGSFILKFWSNFLTSRQSIPTLGKPSFYLDVEVIIMCLSTMVPNMLKLYNFVSFA